MAVRNPSSLTVSAEAEQYRVRAVVRADGSSSPTVGRFELWRREAGDTGDGLRIAVLNAVGTSTRRNATHLDYFVRSGTEYEYRARATDSQGGNVSGYSGWVR